jgi:hypothetical protein
VPLLDLYGKIKSVRRSPCWRLPRNGTQKTVGEKKKDYSGTVVVVVVVVVVVLIKLENGQR